MKPDYFLLSRLFPFRMVRTGVKVLGVDSVLLVTEYLVLQDVLWRSAYASSEGLSPSYSYSLLTQFFTMAGRSLVLESPPTLDWVLVLLVVLVILNLWYSIVAIRRWRRGNTSAQDATAARALGPLVSLG